MQESIKLPFTSAYTSQFREKLIESTSIKGFHITAELGRSHSISNFSQHTFKGNLEGTLLKQTMRYQDQTGIYNLSQFAHVPIPGEPYLYERIDHNSSRWNVAWLAPKFHEVRFESSICSLLDPNNLSAYRFSYNYPEESIYGSFLHSHFGGCR